jgi:hypothetical protein
MDENVGRLSGSASASQELVRVPECIDIHNESISFGIEVIGVVSTELPRYDEACPLQHPSSTP